MIGRHVQRGPDLEQRHAGEGRHADRRFAERRRASAARRCRPTARRAAMRHSSAMLLRLDVALEVAADAVRAAGRRASVSLISSQWFSISQVKVRANSKLEIERCASLSRSKSAGRVELGDAGAGARQAHGRVLDQRAGRPARTGPRRGCGRARNAARGRARRSARAGCRAARRGRARCRRPSAPGCRACRASPRPPSRRACGARHRSGDSRTRRRTRPGGWSSRWSGCRSRSAP